MWEGYKALGQATDGRSSASICRPVPPTPPCLTCGTCWAASTILSAAAPTRPWGRPSCGAPGTRSGWPWPASLLGTPSDWPWPSSCSGSASPSRVCSRSSSCPTVPLVALAPLVGGAGTCRSSAWTGSRGCRFGVAAYLSACRRRLIRRPSRPCAPTPRRCRAGPRGSRPLASAVPYLVPALKLAAPAVVGRGRGRDLHRHRGGIGRLIIEYAREGTSDRRRSTRPSWRPPCSAWPWPASSPSSTCFLMRNRPKAELVVSDVSQPRAVSTGWRRCSTGASPTRSTPWSTST